MITQAITLIYIILTSAFHLYFYTGQERESFRESMSSAMGILSAIAFILSIAVIWPVAALLSYHVRVSLLKSSFQTINIFFISFSF